MILIVMVVMTNYMNYRIVTYKDYVSDEGSNFSDCNHDYCDNYYYDHPVGDDDDDDDGDDAEDDSHNMS
jgi:hypothetical protein